MTNQLLEQAITGSVTRYSRVFQRLSSQLLHCWSRFGEADVYVPVRAVGKWWKWYLGVGAALVVVGLIVTLA